MNKVYQAIVYEISTYKYKKPYRLCFQTGSYLPIMLISVDSESKSFLAIG